MMSNSKGHTLYYGGAPINHEGKKPNYEGEKASYANSLLHAYDLGL